MGYNGYANEATYTTALLIDNERGVYDEMRTYIQQTRDPKRAAPLLRALVEDVLAGRSTLLSPEEQKLWRRDIRRGGGLAVVDWQELAESEMGEGSGILVPQDFGLSRSRGGSLLGRTSDRVARRAGRR